MKRPISIFTALLILICSYLNNSLYAQEISGVEIIPEYPTNSDEILFVVSTTFPLLDCRLDSLHPYFACGAFAYDAFYGSSFESGNCERTDTIILGPLQNGFYPITYRMYYLGWSQVDQVDTVITVGTVGQKEYDGENTSLKIWPNPSTGLVNILPEAQIDRINVYTSTGQLLETYELNNDEFEQIRLSLPAGLYICTPIRNGLPLPAQRLLVQDN
jgi:hypothetical protein